MQRSWSAGQQPGRQRRHPHPARSSGINPPELTHFCVGCSNYVCLGEHLNRVNTAPALVWRSAADRMGRPQSSRNSSRHCPDRPARSPVASGVQESDTAEAKRGLMVA